MLVAGFAGHGSIAHAHEVANEVRRISKQLKDCQTMSQTYNSRERLLGLPVTNVSERESIQQHDLEIHFVIPDSRLFPIVLNC